MESRAVGMRQVPDGGRDNPSREQDDCKVRFHPLMVSLSNHQLP